MRTSPLLFFVTLAALPVVAGDTLIIEGAWVRSMPPSQTMTAAYMSLRNTGAAIEIVGATADGARRAELHTSLVRDGMAQMRPMKRLPLAAGATVELSPGGTHLMLMGIESMPERGARVSICLKLAGTTSSEVCTEATVGTAAPPGESIGGDHQHPHP